MTEKQITDLAEPLTAEALAKGQAEPPEDLIKFFNVLYTGSTGTLGLVLIKHMVVIKFMEILLNLTYFGIKHF